MHQHTQININHKYYANEWKGTHRDVEVITHNFLKYHLEQ